MTRIIHELPFFEQTTSVQVHGRPFPVKREQIVLWVSVADPGLEQLDPRTPRIPALLDTGCNHNFVINQQHLTAWADIHPDYLPKLASVRVSGERVSQFAANVWLHPNACGHSSELVCELSSTAIDDASASAPTAGFRYSVEFSGFALEAQLPELGRWKTYGQQDRPLARNSIIASNK